jgi:hypothetical protein
MASYLGQHFDAGLDVTGIRSREELEERQVDRLKLALATVLITSSIPRRLGADATSEELALDKKRARRTAHALQKSLSAWTKRMELPMDDEIRAQGAQMNWTPWREAFLANLADQVRSVATWSVTHGEESWGKSAIVRLTNEQNWVTYALRD